jgi:NADPH2:quinone reductase
VKAAGLNRGDTMQRRGLYPPPPGITDIPGLEVAGHVAALGASVTGWAVGDPVCALLAGGGYAGYAVAPAGQCLPIPPRLSMTQAAGLPETLFTCWMTLIDDGHLQPGHTVLIHGGSSGIGTMGIPLAKALGARVAATAGSEEKCQACRDLGADLVINYKTQDFVERISAQFGANSVNLVLDMVAGDYVGRDFAVMAPGGRHVNIALLGGISSTIPMGLMMQKGLTLVGSTLRGRSPVHKAAIATAITEKALPMVEDGRITPVVHAALPLGEAAEAHRILESGGHIGKIILTID